MHLMGEPVVVLSEPRPGGVEIRKKLLGGGLELVEEAVPPKGRLIHDARDMDLVLRLLQARPTQRQSVVVVPPVRDICLDCATDLTIRHGEERLFVIEAGVALVDAKMETRPRRGPEDLEAGAFGHRVHNAGPPLSAWGASLHRLSQRLNRHVVALLCDLQGSGDHFSPKGRDAICVSCTVLKHAIQGLQVVLRSQPHLLQTAGFPRPPSPNELLHLLRDGGLPVLGELPLDRALPPPRRDLLRIS